MKQDKEETIYKYLEYCKLTGAVFVLDKDGNRVRQALPDADMYFQGTVQGHKLKIKFRNLVWFLISKHKVQKDEVVFHRDLDVHNFNLNNLVLVKRSEFNRINEALRNMQGHLKLTQSKSCVFSYVITYRQNGKVQKEIIHDNALAKKRYLQLQLKFSKILSKYVCTS